MDREMSPRYTQVMMVSVAGGRACVRYVITKLSLMDSLPNFLTHGAPLRALSKFVVMFFVYTINK